MIALLVSLVFILGILTILYTYVGYPLVLIVLSRFVDRNDQRDRTVRPSVTMIVAAHNEEAVIREKIENTQAIEYAGGFDCIIVSDSTDRTDAIVEQHTGSRTRLLPLEERRGKSYALNRAVAEATGDVLVFSDANTMYDSDAVTELVAPLADDDVGLTTGSLRLVDAEGESTESSYWKYELGIRKLESKLGTTVSANGGMLALRRDDFERIPEAALTDDFIVVLQQAKNGRRIVFVDAAKATERTTGDLWQEYRRRIRIGAGNYQSLVWYRTLLSPRHGLVAFEFFSHKVLRWCLPAVLLLVLLSNAALALLVPSLPVITLLAGQLVCYGAAAVGMTSPRARSSTLFGIPAYFLSMNLAFASGFIQFLSGTSIDIWTSTRDVN
ncbi:MULTISPECIES: glycosyltransferase family 2 protein [unclassified Haladaptatus]|uniref:glycosyltransferase family 2 protein n=1 Tax=unclassified Haladaptatus TaxID=2622732 RepID=UPI00209BF52F|nr:MULTISPECIES: glycosyltransferase family 2 protein [unclassified Haladaptatus]MCO8256362.1 glycosyltransferase family 2 protein [Haladaptatus sp. AB618]